MLKNFNKIVLIVVFVLFAANVNAIICESATKFINDETIFCNKTYYMPEGIKVTTDDTTLDCNGAVIRGDGEGAGITIKNYNRIKIEDCVFEGFEHGIYFSGSENSSVYNTVLRNNKIGIYFIRSNLIQTVNAFIGNQDDVFNADVDEEPVVEEKIPEPVVEETPEIEPIAEPPVEPVEEEKSYTKWIIGFVLLILVVVVLYFVLGKKKEQPVEEKEVSKRDSILHDKEEM